MYAGRVGVRVSGSCGRPSDEDSPVHWAIPVRAGGVSGGAASSQVLCAHRHHNQAPISQASLSHHNTESLMLYMYEANIYFYLGH